MRNSVLPVMTVLTIVAGAVGLQLGESAIGQIDPLYFEGREPLRDVSKDPRPPSSSAFAQASGWAEGYQARAEDCGDGCTPVMPATAAAPAAPLYAYSDPTIEPRWQYADDAASGDEVRAEARAAFEEQAPEPADTEGPTGL
jgi:hypothetical protein